MFQLWLGRHRNEIHPQRFRKVRGKFLAGRFRYVLVGPGHAHRCVVVVMVVVVCLCFVCASVFLCVLVCVCMYVCVYVWGS